MGALNDDMKRIVTEQRLGFVATVCSDGTPNLSPKGTFAVWDDDHLVFAHLHSPQTVANIEAGRDVVEINLVDPILRKGYRFKGPASVHRTGGVYEEGLRFFWERSRLDPVRIKAIVLVRVAQSAPVWSPAYDDGSNEEEIAVRSLARLGLSRIEPIAARPHLPHGLVTMRDPEGNEFCVSHDQAGRRERFTLSVGVYAVRADGRILWLRRREGSALALQFFLPGGKVDAGELPIDGAARELFEESGLAVDELRPVGSYPILLSGRRSLQLTYWGQVLDPRVTLSEEHDDHQWVDPVETFSQLTDEAIASIADGQSVVATLLEHVREDRRRFLAARLV